MEVRFSDRSRAGSYLNCKLRIFQSLVTGELQRMVNESVRDQSNDDDTNL